MISTVPLHEEINDQKAEIKQLLEALIIKFEDDKERVSGKIGTSCDRLGNLRDNLKYAGVEDEVAGVLLERQCRYIRHKAEELKGYIMRTESLKEELAK